MDINASTSINSSELICGICGEDHKYSDCNVIEIKKHIRDNVIPTKARLSLPDSVGIETMADGSHCIIANAYIEKGTQFGPLEAHKLLTLNPSIIFPMKVFNVDVEDLSEYYLDTCDENTCNWMIFVTPAQSDEEQNLICFQEKSNIYYLAVKDIQAGDFLRVWYSTYYAKRMKKNILTTQNPPEYYNNSPLEPIDLNELLKKQQNIMERDSWACKFCGKLENDVSLFATHILEHYSKKFMKKCCNICKLSFANQRKLRRHIKSKHDKEANNAKKFKMKVTVPDKAKNKDILVGGPPLLNDLLNDSLDNTNLVMPCDELNNFGITLGSGVENQNMLMEADSLSLNVDNLVTENVRELDHFNFEIGESQEQYVCDVCLKAFSKLAYLLQHLKKHTGKYTCRNCLKIFCRGENLNAHKCNNDYVTRVPKFVCSLCQRGFMLRKYLVRHMNAIHDKKYTCEHCGKQYHSHKEYKEHNCSAVPNIHKPTFTCNTCNKYFFREVYLKKHMRTHMSREKQKLPSKQLICEVCAQRFSTKKGLHLHTKIHLERDLMCGVCNKKFYRQDVLDNHMITHGDAKVTCSICNIKLKSKRNLAIHMLQHTGVKPHKCDVCSEAFHQRSHLVKHYTKVHLKTCRLCRKSFDTEELLNEHNKTDHILKEYFACPLCKKFIKLKSSLRRHLKQFHPDHNANTVMVDVRPQEFEYRGSTESCNIESLFSETLGVMETVNNNNNSSSDNNRLSSEHNTYIDTGVTTNLNLKDTVPENDHDSFESIVDNFATIMNSYGSPNDANNLLPAFDPMVESTTNQTRILDFNDLEMDLDSNFGLQPPVTNVNNREVCLSMPDLMESDQEITLGENAYMLEDGTIVEPKDQGNVLVYILGKKMFE